MNTGHTTLDIMKNAGWYNNWLLNCIKPYIGKEILEVGGGIGNFSSVLRKFGDVTVVDIESEYVDKLKKIKGIKAGLGDIEKGKYFFKDKKFDTIICMNVLEHIDNHELALKNMCNLLTKTGKLILLVPAHNWAYGKMDENLGHFRRYNKTLAKNKMENAGFKLVKLRYLNMLGIFGWFVNARILKKEVIPSDQLRIFDFISRPLLMLENIISSPFGLSVLAVGEKK